MEMKLSNHQNAKIFIHISVDTIVKIYNENGENINGAINNKNKYFFIFLLYVKILNLLNVKYTKNNNKNKNTKRFVFTEVIVNKYIKK